mgnify:CR=1 FL=1
MRFEYAYPMKLRTRMDYLYVERGGRYLSVAILFRYVCIGIDYGMIKIAN